MIPALARSLIAASLLVGAWAVLAALRERRVSAAQLVAAAAVETLLVAQAVVAVVVLTRNGRGVDAVTFVGYLMTSVLLLPVGALWAVAERSRWGNGVLAVTGFAVAVLVLRLQQIWSGSG